MASTVKVPPETGELVEHQRTHVQLCSSNLVWEYRVFTIHFCDVNEDWTLSLYPVMLLLPANLKVCLLASGTRRQRLQSPGHRTCMARLQTLSHTQSLPCSHLNEVKLEGHSHDEVSSPAVLPVRVASCIRLMAGLASTRWTDKTLRM